MTDKFDPYYKWLGIPPREQPPTHYRLLGVEQFESDPDVISHAADQRMTHIRSLQAGKNAALSQKILNQISAARLCLLDPEKKAAYDAGLRGTQSSSTSAPAPPINVAAARPVKRGFPVVAVGAGVGLLLLVALAIGAFIVSRGGDADRKGVDVAARNVSPTKPISSDPAGPPVASPADGSPPAGGSSNTADSATGTNATTNSGGDAAGGGSPSPSVTTVPSENGSTPSVSPPTGTDAPPSDSSLSPSPEKPAQEPPSLDDGPTAKPPAETPARETARLAVPDAEPLAQAKQLVRDVYEDQYLAAKDDPQKLSSLAEAMLREVDQADAAPASRFALLQAAADMAALGGDVTLSWQAYGALKQRFDVDVKSVRLRMIEGVAGAVRPADQNKTVAQQMLVLIDNAEASDDYAAATALADGSVALARKARDVELVKQAVARGKEISAAADHYQQEVAPSLATLKSNPDDPAANLIVGKYLVLTKGDWREALPLLAKGPPTEAYQAAAAAELAGEGDKIKAADAWYDLGRKGAGEAATKQLLAHARELYQANVDGLSGLVQTRVQLRIEELAKIDAPAKPTADVAARETPRPGRSTPRRPGQPLPVKVIGAACNFGQVRINGVEVFPKQLNREVASVAPAVLKPGDVIAATNGGRNDTNSLWLVFVDADGEFLFETTTDWKSYRPPNESAWWNFDLAHPPQVAPTEYREASVEYVDRVQRSVGTVLPMLPISLPIHSTLPAANIRDPEYMYYVVTAEDLTPKSDRIHSTADDKGLPRPAAGERMPVNVVLAGNNRVDLRINGEPVFKIHTERKSATTGRAALREGDLIVVRMEERFNISCARVVILDSAGGVLLQTSPDWIGFLPDDPVRWWDLYRAPPKQPQPAEFRASRDEYATEVQAAISRAAPTAPDAMPVYSPVRAAPDRDPASREPTYLYYNVKKDDLAGGRSRSSR